MKTDKCRSCGRPIIWCFMVKSGKRMPVDAAPTSDGTIALDEGTDGSVKASVAGPAPELLWEPRYTSHFATCPEAGRWRRG